jgi:hypothetical protein
VKNFHLKNILSFDNIKFLCFLNFKNLKKYLKDQKFSLKMIILNTSIDLIFLKKISELYKFYFKIQYNNQNIKLSFFEFNGYPFKQISYLTLL